jgi:hypothetical protein
MYEDSYINLLMTIIFISLIILFYCYNTNILSTWFCKSTFGIELKKILDLNNIFDDFI